MFVDDLKLFCTVQNQDEVDVLQYDLNTIYEWCTNNNFTRNISKCQFMTFFRDRVVAKFV